MAVSILQLSSWFLIASYLMYMTYCLLNLYALFYPSSCPFYASKCLKNYVTKTPYPQLKLWVYSSTSQSPNGSDLYPVWELDDYKANESFTKDVTVRIPLLVHNNGTMFLHVFLTPVEEGGGGRGEDNPFEADWVVNRTGKHTYISHQTPLQVTSDDPAEKQDLSAGDHLHWRSRLPLRVMTTDVKYDITNIPSGLTSHKYIRLYEDHYLPVLMIDELGYRTKDLLPLNKTRKEMPLTISYSPITHGPFCVRLNIMFNHEVNGTAAREIDDDLKEVVTNELSTVVIGDCILLFFLLLCLLNAERDISFWQDKKTMAGLSAQAVVWRSVCTLVIFLHVIDQDRTFFNLTVFSIQAIVEIWKLTQVFQVRVNWTEWRLVYDVPNAAVSDKERETQELDSQAMRCLSYALYPLWVAVVIYNLMYNSHMSWFSLSIQCFYFGFRWCAWIFMLPQVFINYKLKSVADLPWEVMLLTAVGDYMMGARLLILGVPLSSFVPYTLDEVFILAYLYQRWLYNN